MGRGNQFSTHPGNVRFYMVLDQHTAAYYSSKTKFEKTRVVQEVFKILSGEGRFLRMESTSRNFFHISDADARQKISHAIRYRFQNGGSSSIGNASGSESQSQSSTTQSLNMRQSPSSPVTSKRPCGDGNSFEHDRRSSPFLPVAMTAQSRPMTQSPSLDGFPSHPCFQASTQERQKPLLAVVQPQAHCHGHVQARMRQIRQVAHTIEPLAEAAIELFSDEDILGVLGDPSEYKSAGDTSEFKWPDPVNLSPLHFQLDADDDDEPDQLLDMTSLPVRIQEDSKVPDSSDHHGASLVGLAHNDWHLLHDFV